MLRYPTLCDEIEEQRAIDEERDARAIRENERLHDQVGVDREISGHALPGDGRYLGQGWYCYLGRVGDKSFGECHRDQVDCGVKLGGRKAKGLEIDTERCDFQAQAACFSAQRSLKEGPRVLCYPEEALCLGSRDQATGMQGVSDVTACKVYP